MTTKIKSSKNKKPGKFGLVSRDVLKTLKKSLPWLKSKWVKGTDCEFKNKDRFLPVSLKDLKNVCGVCLRGGMYVGAIQTIGDKTAFKKLPNTHPLQKHFSQPRKFHELGLTALQLVEQINAKKIACISAYGMETEALVCEKSQAYDNPGVTFNDTEATKKSAVVRAVERAIKYGEKNLATRQRLRMAA